jgi:hypothetical protein
MFFIAGVDIHSIARVNAVTLATEHVDEVSFGHYRI